MADTTINPSRSILVSATQIIRCWDMASESLSRLLLTLAATPADVSVVRGA